MAKSTLWELQARLEWRELQAQLEMAVAVSPALILKAARGQAALEARL